MPTEFHLVLHELQKFSFTGNERISVEKKGMEDVLRCEDKPLPLQLSNEQMSRSEARDLCKVAFTQLTYASNDISIFARIAVSFRSKLEECRKRGLNPLRSRR